MLYYRHRGGKKKSPEKDVRDKKDATKQLMKGWYSPMKK